ncbi:MAG TPA: cell wall-binding repeat-containing protein [Solirubrobacteraceae bacterium]|nr:cell wall-binding repeat-containing protein [Solirubrobacteraceae bacterium]
MLLRGRFRTLPALSKAVIGMAAAAFAVAGCGGGTHLLASSTGSASGAVRTVVTQGSSGGGGSGGQTKLDFPLVATKNTTRVGGTPIQNAAAVALAVYPSAIPGTHPPGVALVSTTDWQGAIAAASLMAAPFRVPVLLSRPGSLSATTRSALRALAPTGEHSLGGAQVVRIGSVPTPGSLRSTSIAGGDPYTLAASIDHFEAQASGHESGDVVVVSADSPAFAMPAAGWAAESGDPILYVNSGSVPGPTVAALQAHHHPHIYVLGPASVIPDVVLSRLKRYGTVKRISGSDPAANSVAFAGYRDPACPSGQPCGHIPHSFGWAIRSPGHAYVLINAADPLNAAAAAPLSSSGGYGPQLLVQNGNTLPKSVLNYFLNYATPGYASQGPTAAVYNHGWLIGPPSAISVGVQAQVDSLLEAVPQR